MSEVVKKESASSVPALVTQPLDLDADDVALRKLKLGQHMSPAVQEGLAEYGDVFVTSGEDDPDPEILASGEKDETVTLHVLDLVKGKSASVDGELQIFDIDDPEAPADSWITYTYFVSIPEYDDYLPVKWLLTRTGRSTAQQINTVLKRNESTAAPHEIAFELTTKSRQNAKGKFVVPVIKQVEAKEENVDIAKTQAELIAQRPDVRDHEDAPGI